jgi:DNA polymerase III epsilon subunit-like protein
MRVLVFDTETTGLPKSKMIDDTTIDLWPHIVQFSYIVFDTETNSIVKLKDHIIKISESIIISEEVVKFHGITNEISSTKGVYLKTILPEFFDDFSKVEHIVGHNISFDLNMLKAELTRFILHDSPINTLSEYKEYLNKLTSPTNIYCTMKSSVELCGIERTTKLGKTYNKFPKLIELYQKLFQICPNNLHNSLNDVIVCLRCFMKIKYDKDIIEYSPEIKQLIKDYL